MADEPPKLELDEDGMVKGCPLLRQSTWTLPDNQILLALEIARNPQQLEAMKGRVVQLSLTKVQVMELARMLTDAGETPYKM